MVMIFSEIVCVPMAQHYGLYVDCPLGRCLPNFTGPNVKFTSPRYLALLLNKTIRETGELELCLPTREGTCQT